MKLDWKVVAPADELGESPFWHPQEQRLYWVDIPARQARRLEPASGAVESWAMPLEPGCMAPAASGGFVLALRDGVYRAQAWSAPLELVARFDHDPRTTRFNDGKADPAGRFWAGTMYEPRDARNAKLYSLDLRQHPPQVETKAGDATIANGLAWSPDATTLYWTDTTSHTIRAWRWNATSNAMTAERVFMRFPCKPAGWQPGAAGYGGRPDGAAVDVQGNYWCAMFEGGRLLQISPGGDILCDIEVPARCPTMPCFGGPDLRTLYLTSASHNRPAAERTALPDSGCVFAARVDVAGLPVNFVSG